jgi:RNA polymerase sigma-70 factor (ECF subfamily)
VTVEELPRAAAAGSLSAMNSDVTRSLDLMAKAQHGDKDALNRLIARYYDRVRSIVHVRMGARLRATLETGDILQEVFVKACQIYDRFDVDEEASLIGWLAQIAQHQITDAADKVNALKRSAAQAIPLDQGTADGETGAQLDPPEPALPPPALIEAAELKAIVEDCLRSMSEEYRELIVQREYMNASWDAVAKAVGRPSAAAARMMHAQALVELGKCVAARRR